MNAFISYILNLFKRNFSYLESPKWIKEPKDTYVIAGANVSLTCEASGFPIPEVSWKKKSFGNSHILYEDIYIDVLLKFHENTYH